MNRLPAILENTIEARKAEITEATKSYKITIETAGCASKASFYLTQVKGHQKDLEALRKSLTKPLDDEKKAIMAAFKPSEQALDETEAHLKSELLRWSEHLKKRQAEEQAKLEAEARKAEEDTKKGLELEAQKAEDDWDFGKAEELKAQAREVRVPALELIAARTIPRGTTEQVLYRYEVTDFSRLPDEFKQVNEKALGEFARKAKGSAQVSGIRFFEEKILKARA